MRYRFFTNSERTWKAMFEAISSARKSVYLEMYIFADNMTQYNFLMLLKEKAKNVWFNIKKHQKSIRQNRYN